MQDDRARAPGVGEHEHLFFLVATALQSLEPLVRREYDEAVQSASHLVANETKFLDFLRTEDMDPVKAAKRLAMYWKYRKEIFEDRWLLPMTQTGHGALSEQDIAVLRTGYKILIKRPSGSGGPLCLVDKSRVTHFPERLSGTHIHTRIGFYLATVMTDVDLQVVGVTIIHVVTSAPRPAVDTNPEGWKMFREALPFRLKNILVAQAYEPWKDALIDSLGYQEALEARFKTHVHPNIIRGDSVESVVNQMQAMGIDRQHLPRSLGGSFDYSSFEDWTRMRLSMEHVMGFAPATTNAMTFPPHPTQQPAQAQVAQQLQVLSVLPTATHHHQAVVAHQPQEEKESDRKRKAERRGSRSPKASPPGQSTTAGKGEEDAASRRGETTRPTFGVMTLAEERQDWERRNQILRRDNRRLEDLLAQAQLVVARHFPGEDLSETADES